MSSAAKKAATYEDLLSVPKHMVAEIIRGTLSVLPRPRSTHARASSRLGGELSGPFDRGRGGPGGWIILDEPELHLGADVLVPDLGAWRRERMPEMPDAAFFTLAPDWVCEVLSPTTAQIDRSDKIPIYAAQQVAFVWLIDPNLRTLEVYKLDGATYRLLRVFKGDERARAEPFEVLDLELAALWQR